MDIKRILKNILLYGIGIIIILLIMWHIGIKEIIVVFLSMNIYLFLVALFMYLLTIFIIAMRWRSILLINNCSAKFINLLLLILMGQFINNITPSMKGGSEPFRAYYLSKLENIPNHISFSSVVIERLLDTLVFLILTFFVIIYFVINGIIYVKELIFVWVVIGGLTILGLYVIMHKTLAFKIALKIAKIVTKYSSKTINEDKIKESIRLFQNNIRFFKNNKSKIIIPFILSFGWWILDIIRIYILFLAIKCNISLLAVSSTYLVSLLIGIIPTLPGSLGTSDAVMIGMYSLFNVSYSKAAAGTILDRIISYGLATIMGALAYEIIKKKLKNKK
ncbi:flippase-like domain-containing protein [Methanothermococcus sp.]|uniref:flippase-like domain-containing protein n=1 Tax=Methanothermococcus sp. TaxID=2614238 RepID=UPI0025DF933B|nr:flippase-like domain-containing protein [Methanothermococcus sp.]